MSCPGVHVPASLRLYYRTAICSRDSTGHRDWARATQAAPRTRSSLWDTLTRRRVRRVCCSLVFPSVLSLGSTSSAPSRPGLFAGFSATMKRSDFSARAPSASTPRLPVADRSKTAKAAKQEISRFPCKECTYMPGSQTTQSRTDARTYAPFHVAFHYANSVSTLI
jgi:hypothetical protein